MEPSKDREAISRQTAIIGDRRRDIRGMYHHLNLNQIKNVFQEKILLYLSLIVCDSF